MLQLLQIGNQPNVSVKQYYVESEEEIENIEHAPVGSVVLILTEDELKIKMLHSSGKWVEI